MHDDQHTANPGYALAQLRRALVTSGEHQDADVRARAQWKVETWQGILQGMENGSLQVGSRTPVTETPAWATLEVVAGGFATGRLMAGGDLQAHEKLVLPEAQAGGDRTAINIHYLMDEGFQELQALLTSGRYRLNTPEEGALLMVAWLLRNGRVLEARSILAEIGPYMSRLRFYPVPDQQPLTASSVVHLQELHNTIDNLNALEPRPLVEVQRESLLVWIPLYDRLVDLFARTVEEDWPCQIYPAGWTDSAAQWLADFQAQRAQHQLCRKPSVKDYAFLRKTLVKCLVNPSSISGREVGLVRVILKGIETKRGLPGSARAQALRDAQYQEAIRPNRKQMAAVMVARLNQLPASDGLDSLEDLLAPVTAEESADFGIPEGQTMPLSLEQKLVRSLNAPVEVLVRKGVITSAEVLAKVLPQIVSQVSAAGIADLELRRLYAALYQAFRRRRSLLLLNLESQVRLNELPWVQVIEEQRSTLAIQEQCLQTLQEVVALAVTSFPHQILPNKLLQEIRSLSNDAALGLPITDELAADIFMGDFSAKFLAAAKKAAELLTGTLYQRYYDIDYAAVLQINDVQSGRYSTCTSDGFASLCYHRAGQEYGGYSYNVAKNGQVIEQQQILTTHNLAVLFDALNLKETLQDQLEKLARDCFVFVCRRQQLKVNDWHTGLVMLKNTAYAWRQMIFFLSLLPGDSQESFILWAQSHLTGQGLNFQKRFAPAIGGLVLAVRGISPTSVGDAAKCFLGWTTGKHWLMP